jgi:transcriptional regulator with XRE-family HTH domain
LARSKQKTLKELRALAGLSRAKVAADMEMSERHVYRLETGVTPLSRFNALRFAAYYGVAVNEIAEPESEEAAA